MKKIININLSGRVIPIEDSAYEKLQAYIESLRRYFAKEEGRDEIINDIESRIAELMDDKIRKGANAITDEDLEAIAASMGRPEDFEAEMAEEETTGNAAPNEPNFSFGKTKKNRLYRNTNDRVLGGVCSGIANYLNIDPAIVRLLFAIITFGGFGFGVLAYIILWIVLPEQGLEGYTGKRLYRNPDDKIIAGVAGGIAAYFNKDAKTIRLIFSIPLLLILLKVLFGIFSAPFFHPGVVFPIAFGSLTGTFVLAYIILWIVLPEANTEYQKMEMRGEKIDVNRIKKNVQDKAREFGDEVKTAAQNFSQTVSGYSREKGKQFAREISQAAGRTGTSVGHAFGVIFKVFFFMIAGSIAFGIFVALMALLFSGVAWWPFNNFLWTSEWQKLFAWGTVIFFLLVPVIAFITWLIRRIMKVKSGSGYMGWTFGFLWFLGWVSATLLAASITRDFRYYEESRNEISINQPSAGKLTLGVSEPELRYRGGYGWMDNDANGWNITDDTLLLSWVKIDVTMSKDTMYHVVLWKNSWGNDDSAAITRADNIVYNIGYSDNYLDLGSGFAVGKEDKYRGQHIVVEVQVPAGKKIRFDETIIDKLNDVDIDVRDNYGRRRSWNRRGVRINSHYFSWRTNIDYTMGDDGLLYNPDGSKPNSSIQDGYRYNDLTPEEKERRIKNDLKKLEESNEVDKKRLEEQLQRIQEEKRKDSLEKQKQASQESMDDGDIRSTVSFDSYTSPIFSMVKFMD